MALEKPRQASDLRYFSRKILENGGKATVWVFAPACPKCGQGRLVIPYDEDTGRYKSRARDFTCNNCKFAVQKSEIKMENPVANIEYVCPLCKAAGEKQTEFKRDSKKVLKFTCDSCGKEVKVMGSKNKSE